MANMYAWHSPAQCDMLLGTMMATICPLSAAAPTSIGTAVDFHKYENVHSHAQVSAHMHAPSSISCSESDNYGNVQHTHAQSQAHAHLQATLSFNGGEMHECQSEHAQVHAHVSNWHSEHSYTTNTTVSAEDLDFLDYPPLVSQERPFLSTSSPDMEIACERTYTTNTTVSAEDLDFL
eukprot:c15821_g5_i1 orf=274-807(+)